MFAGGCIRGSRQEAAGNREEAAHDSSRHPATCGRGVRGICLHDAAGSGAPGAIRHPAPLLQAAQPQSVHLWGGPGGRSAGQRKGGQQRPHLTAGETGLACSIMVAAQDEPPR